MFEFHVPGSFYLVRYCAKTHTDTETHTNAHIDSDEYSIDAFCKSATIMKLEILNLMHLVQNNVQVHCALFIQISSTVNQHSN